MLYITGDNIFILLIDIDKAVILFLYLTMEERIVKAIAEVDLNEIERLLKISDFLHKGMPSYGGYTQNQMLTDMKYEEALSFLKEQRALEIVINDKPITDDKDKRKMKEETLMFMDGIQIVDAIPSLKHVILMPKFDGCSVGCEMVKVGDTFKISKAHTRGCDNLEGNRKCQDKTSYLQTVSTELMERINKVITNKSLNLQLNLHYKDSKLIGNENVSKRIVIDLHNIDYMLVRGEFVSNDKNNINNDKLPSTAVGLAAGALNAKEDKFNEYKPFINYIPFEIALLKLRNG